MSRYKKGKNPNSHIRTRAINTKTSNTLRKRHKEKSFGFIKGFTPWNKGLKGFRKGIPRHEYDDSFRKKISDSMKERIAKGYTPWNKGLLKSNNKKLKTMGKRVSTTHKLRGNLRGEKNPNFKGWVSLEPYTKEFNNKFKKAVRKRDNYICLKCGKHQEKLKRTLIIHHINYNKMLSIPQNCCSLCNKCNSEVNFNRKHWIKFFQSLLSEKYGYQYSKVGIIKLNIRRYKNE